MTINSDPCTLKSEIHACLLHAFSDKLKKIMAESSNITEFTCPAGISDCPLKEYVAKLRKRCRELEELVDHDPLTGLFNYRFLLHSLAREMERTRRNGEPLALIMIDIDSFKQINDDLGHETGNCVLKEIASILTKNTRQSDLVCRYGGDELAVILPGIGLFRAVRTAERLRRLILAYNFDMCSSLLSVTVSAGIDVFTRKDSDSPEEFISRADTFLRKAKKEGKNRICAPEPAREASDTQLTVEEKKALSEEYKG